MDKIFKIGVFGLTRGSMMCEIFAKEFENTEVTAICETNQEAIEKCRKFLSPDVKIFDDFDAFLESGLDAVVLSNYFHEHASCAIKAMKAGVAVLSETTAAPSLGECVELVEAAEKYNGRYMLAANCLYFPALHAMKPMIEEGKYGKVNYAEAEYIHGSDAEPELLSEPDLENLHWRSTLPSSYYNMHTLAPLMYITGTMPVKVFSKASYEPDYSKKYKKLSDCQSAVVLTEMDSGAVFNTTGVVRHHPNSKWYRVSCDHAIMETVRYNQAEDLLHVTQRGHDVRQLWYKWRTAGIAPENYVDGTAERYGHGGIDYFMCYRFKEFLEGKYEPYFDVYRSVALSAVGILSWYSALSGKEYAVPDFKNKADRDKVRHDYRKPIAKAYKDLTLPCRLDEKEKFEDLF